jgi:deoxyribodipyrimidine photo-lyase
MEIKFDTSYNAILEKIDTIDPIKYGRSRNYIDGDVTYLSPYISRGVISTKQVLEIVLKKGYKIYQIEQFVKELCWRDYFQRVAQVKDLNTEIKYPQSPILNREIPSNILEANTGIDSIDDAINTLYQTGYMHNHCRMYTASIICNVAKSHWHHPAQWMYYHLLDGDWASNACSWQWVAAANSSKKYFANQENINKYTYSNQRNTFMDKSYEEIETMETPTQLLDTKKFELQLKLPESTSININKAVPTFIYNYYNLDPQWHKGEVGNRILLIDPEFFSRYPVSKKCIDFMLDLSKNIPDIQMYIGNFKTLVETHQIDHVYFKEHPLYFDYKGIKEERDWIAEKVTGYFPSFFAYWKKVEKQLK